MGSVAPIPQGFQTITPHIVIAGAGKAIEFYKKAFGAEEMCRMPGPDGQSVMYAELQIGSSRLMMCDEFPGGCMQSPATLKGTAVQLHLYVENADAAFDRALKAGAQVVMPLTDMFWGDRYGVVKDPFGHSWSIATHKEDLTPDEIGKRAAAAFGGKGGCPA